MANERQFKVLVIAMSLKNNGIAKSKDIVSESQLAAPAHELVEGGYIELLEGSNEEAPKAESDAINDLEDAIPGGKKGNSKK